MSVPVPASVGVGSELVSVRVTRIVLTACPLRLATDCTVVVKTTGAVGVDGGRELLWDVLVEVEVGVMLSGVVVVGGIDVGVGVVVDSDVLGVVSAIGVEEVVVSATDVEVGSAVELNAMLDDVVPADVVASEMVDAATTELVLSEGCAVLLLLVDIVTCCLDKLLLGGAMLAAVKQG